ncbi:MAG: DUF4364 family protein [Candidatus Improbicoccus pseudotrichonymphae]|uniref:DUF4364 family protein n=1 Tax=Candidatus Improbicoccus pseudotrichonymphae TaxID=3033792 RepID=A0AA48KYF8_9FIRM|nr:MAG: DUF4364 family protein [Candidatus Improbicoccus pseudotrichonymphae]
MKKEKKINLPLKNYSKDEIKILICYIFYKINKPLKKDFIIFILQYNDVSNYFQISDIFSELIKSQCIVEYISLDNSKNKNEKFILTQVGGEIAKHLNGSLPITLKESIMRSISKHVSTFQNEKISKAEIKKNSSGYDVKCCIFEENFNIMELCMYAPDLSKAIKIKNTFYEKMHEIYKNLIDQTS